MLDHYGSRYLVESLEVSNLRGLAGIIGKLVLQVSNQHSKLSAPVSNMVQPKRQRKIFKVEIMIVQNTE